jgi:hypothetical protein
MVVMVAVPAIALTHAAVAMMAARVAAMATMMVATMVAMLHGLVRFAHSTTPAVWLDGISHAVSAARQEVSGSMRVRGEVGKGGTAVDASGAGGRDRGG